MNEKDMTEEKKTPEEKFQELVKNAEDYIIKNAKDILVAHRNQEKFRELIELFKQDEKDSIQQKIEEINLDDINCLKLINEKYQPQYSVNEIKKSEKIETILLKRFCEELQNQSGRTNAIKYFSYGKGQENKIFKIVAKYYEGNKNNLKGMKWCDLYNSFGNSVIEREKPKDSIKACETCENKNECKTKSFHNFGWREYSRGLIDALKYISKLEIKKFKEDISIINNIDNVDNLKTRKDILKKLEQMVHSLGSELVYDFFKELCCENLIKPDVHIKYLYKEIIKGEKKNSYDIAEDIIRMCKESNYTPYYIDKILWLCCTGNFHEDGITINAMTRENFILTYYSKLGKPKR